MEIYRLPNAFIIAYVLVIAGFLVVLLIASSGPLISFLMPSAASAPLPENGSGDPPPTLSAGSMLMAVDLVGDTPPRNTLRANFTWTDPAIPGTVAARFIDSSSGSPTAWHWNFGDGKGSNEQNPIHLYTSRGFYRVTLTVVNATHSTDTLQQDCSPLYTKGPDDVQGPLAPTDTDGGDAGGGPQANTTTVPDPTLDPSPEPTDTMTPEPTDTMTPEPTDTMTPEPTPSEAPTPAHTKPPKGRPHADD